MVERPNDWLSTKPKEKSDEELNAMLEEIMQM